MRERYRSVELVKELTENLYRTGGVPTVSRVLCPVSLSKEHKKRKNRTGK